MSTSGDLKDVEEIVRLQVRIHADEARKIQAELFGSLSQKGLGSNLPNHVQGKIEEVLDRLKASAGDNYNLQKAMEYVDWLLKYPWNTIRPITHSIAETETRLRASFYGRDDVLDELLDHIAVYLLNKDSAPGLRLCFVGPQGTGKTFVAKKIAEALGFNWTVATMGGAADASWVKGIPRHYAGSQPGRIIRGMCTAKHLNCVFILDEIDKIGESREHGSPSHALLEVVDPDTNEAFEDHYFEVPVNLSKAIFIGIANNEERVNPVLLDRFHTVYFDDYTLQQKVDILEQFTWKEIRSKYGLDQHHVSIRPAALKKIAEKYETSPGMREVKRGLARIAAKICRKLVTQQEMCDVNVKSGIVVTPKNLTQFL